MADPLTDDAARAMRRLWFNYLDAIAPIRPKLHAYCLRLTGSIFDAEDLLQDTLLKGFGAIATGQYHSEGIPDRRAYLCRIATNAWIDEQRKRARARSAVSAPAEIGRETPPLTSAAGAALFERASPQERAAVVLKDVFDYSLAEIAMLLSTSVGAVKSALHRGRESLAINVEHAPARLNPASVELIDRFVAAFAARDINAVTALLLETVTYEVQGVGTEHGRKGNWITINLANMDIAGVRSERLVLEGEQVVAGIYRSGANEYLVSLVRLEESEGKVARLINYFFCPDTLTCAATALGYLPPKRDYHQDEATLLRMIADCRLPWLDALESRPI